MTIYTHKKVSIPNRHPFWKDRLQYQEIGILVIRINKRRDKRNKSWILRITACDREESPSGDRKLEKE